MDVASAVVGALVALVAAAWPIYTFAAKRERLQSVRATFDQALDLLTSEEEGRRRAGAIILRRFFDKRTEQGRRDLPYMNEARNIIAASLRGMESGPVQKLLADGLAFAPTLARVDLQRTNLQDAYLGPNEGKPIVLTRADFFGADLTRASLRGASAQGAVFYRARLIETVLRDADLRGANFREADLLRARFDGAELDGADFTDARNIPSVVRHHLSGCASGVESTNEDASRARVFISRPAAMAPSDRALVRAAIEQVEEAGLEAVVIDRSGYPYSGPLSEVRRQMSGAQGVLVIALADLTIAAGVWREGTPDSLNLVDHRLSSPWTGIELGMSIGLGLPVLLATGPGLTTEGYDFRDEMPDVRSVSLAQDHRSRRFVDAFEAWASEVRARG